MSNTYTPNVGLAMPAAGDRTWNVPVNGNARIVDSLTPVGALGAQTTEVPSATLNVKIAGGNYIKQDGSVATYAGLASRAMTATATNYLYLDLTNSGALTLNTTGFPTTAHVRIAVVAAGASVITSIADSRIAFDVIGSWADGVNIELGTVIGTQWGTSPNQKQAFWGVTPVSQPVSTTDLRMVLIALGLLAAGGATPLNLDGGELTAGSATIVDGGNVALGTGTGTQIGTSTAEKLAFFGKTPVVQPTMGAATAGTTYTTNEQAMLQTVYNAVRALGLGS